MWSWRRTRLRRRCTLERVKVLVTVKTYPVPSQTYEELVCTTGIRETGRFIRLYPIRFRYLPPEQQYDKYQWIRVDVTKNPQDPRPESYRPIPASIKLLEHVGTEDRWSRRAELVLPHLSESMQELREKQELDGTSLGIIRPAEVSEFYWEPASDEKMAKYIDAMKQLKLFEPRKPLEPIPYDFGYRFYCQSPDCRGHEMSIIDWEVGQLYRRMLRKLRDSEAAAAAVKHRFLNDLCGDSVDTYFYVGNMLKWTNVWLVLGVFWPPRSPQSSLPL